MDFLLDPNILIALATLTALEIVLGIDNLVFMSIMIAKLPQEQQARARMIGLSSVLAIRLGFLAIIGLIIKATMPVGWEAGTILGVAYPAWTVPAIFDHVLSWRDLLLVVGGFFLLYKAAGEIHERLEVDEEDHEIAIKNTLFGVLRGIMYINVVFSLDSIITAVGMTDSLFVMMFAIIVSTVVMLVLAKPLGNFLHNHPTLVMLSFSFLVLIGFTLVAEGFGYHVSKELVYVAMAFATANEMLNIFAGKSAKKRVELKARFTLKKSS